jgi:hypothetical protein
MYETCSHHGFLLAPAPIFPLFKTNVQNGGIAQAAEYLPSKHKVLSSNPRITKTKQNNNNKNH